MPTYRFQTTCQHATIKKDYEFEAVNDRAAIEEVCEREKQHNADVESLYEGFDDSDSIVFGDGILSRLEEVEDDEDNSVKNKYADHWYDFYKHDIENPVESGEE